MNTRTPNMQSLFEKCEQNQQGELEGMTYVVPRMNDMGIYVYHGYITDTITEYMLEHPNDIIDITIDDYQSIADNDEVGFDIPAQLIAIQGNHFQIVIPNDSNEYLIDVHHFRLNDMSLIPDLQKYCPSELFNAEFPRRQIMQIIMQELDVPFSYVAPFLTYKGQREWMFVPSQRFYNTHDPKGAWRFVGYDTNPDVVEAINKRLVKLWIKRFIRTL